MRERHGESVRGVRRIGWLALLLAAGWVGVAAAQPDGGTAGSGSGASNGEASGDPAGSDGGEADGDSGGAPGLTSPEDSPRKLNEKRWRDRSHGLSVRFPVGTQSRREVGDKYLFRLADNDGLFTMSLQTKQSKSELTLSRVAEAAREQLQSATATVRILEQKGTQLGERPAILLYANAPKGGVRERRIMFGQGIVRLDPQTFAVFEVRCDLADRRKVRPIYEAMLSTLKITPPEVLNKRREEEIQRGHEWRQNVSVKELHNVLTSQEQFFRLIDNGNDLGYMRVKQTTANRQGEQGVRIVVQTRIVRPEFTVDSVALYFLADDDGFEYWSIKTTRRPRAGSKQERDRRSQSFVNQGIRADGVITITRDGPQDNSRRKYPVPKKGYLSQVEAWLLPKLLPADRPTTYGFYCYNAGTGQVNYRTEKVIPVLNGFTIESRLTPNDPPMKGRYKADGSLVEKELSSGLKRVPTEASRIPQFWRNR